MSEVDEQLQSGTRRRTWAIVVALVIAGAVFTWLAFGIGIQDKPTPDVFNGVDLVQPGDRTGKPGR